MSTWRAVGVALAMMLILVVTYAGQVSTRQHAQNATEVRPQGKLVLPDRPAPPGAKPAASFPPEDAPGREVPDLPRYPGSVRVEYERK